MEHTIETREKLSKMRKGEANPFFGKRHTPETKAKLVAALCQHATKRTYEIAPPTIVIPSNLDLAYLAGIVDGEGSIKFAKNRPFVAIYNSNLDLIHWIERLTGIGALAGADRRGRVPCLTWRVGGSANVFLLCKALLPLLIVKKHDAEKVIQHLITKYGMRIEGYLRGN